MVSLNDCKKYMSEHLMYEAKQICAGGMEKEGGMGKQGCFIFNIISIFIKSFQLIAICHYNRLDTCGGDSGGAFQQIANTNEGPKYFLTGIVSYGKSECGILPAIYTRVSYYVPFILDFMLRSSV